jgi:hypothetical protein
LIFCAWRSPQIIHKIDLPLTKLPIRIRELSTKRTSYPQPSTNGVNLLFKGKRYFFPQNYPHSLGYRFTQRRNNSVNNSHRQAKRLKISYPQGQKTQLSPSYPKAVDKKGLMHGRFADGNVCFIQISTALWMEPAEIVENLFLPFAIDSVLNNTV